jgi:hypothetical protein
VPVESNCSISFRGTRRENEHVLKLYRRIAEDRHHKRDIEEKSEDKQR